LCTNIVIGKTRGDEKKVTSNKTSNNYVENRKHSSENKKIPRCGMKCNVNKSRLEL
jgi:hypothetical protein